MQPTGRMGAGRRAGGALLGCREGSVKLCGRGLDGPRLMRRTLGRAKSSSCNRKLQVVQVRQTAAVPTKPLLPSQNYYAPRGWLHLSKEEL